MSNDEQLAWEARAGRPAAAAAILSALTGIAGWILYQSVIADRRDGTDGFLEAIDRQASAFVASGALQALSILLLIPPLLYLYRAIKHRRPDLTQAAAVLAVLGAVAFAASTVLQQLKLVDIAREFFPFDVSDDASELQGDAYAEAVDPDKAAEKFARDELSPALQGIGLGGTFSLAFSVVMLSINAIRVGLLSRFMGILGVAMGAMFVIPFGIQPILQLFWLCALGLLILGLWPGGRGPAWQTGEAIPWPSGGRQREQIEGEPAEGAHTDGGAPRDPAADQPKPASRKRRKKRR